jgi:hypothetical protein
MIFLLVLLQAVAGLQPDGRQIVNRAQDEATQYKSCVSHGSWITQLYSNHVSLQLSCVSKSLLTAAASLVAPRAAWCSKWRAGVWAAAKHVCNIGKQQLGLAAAVAVWLMLFEALPCVVGRRIVSEPLL